MNSTAQTSPAAIALTAQLAAIRNYRALVRKRKRLYAKAIRMHPVQARPLFVQLDELDGEIERALIS